MIPDQEPQHKPQIPPMVPLDAELTFPDNDPGPGAGARVVPDGPACCPTCGRPPFDLRTSGVLDALQLARDVVSDAIALVEEGVLP